jgi:RimJ/RimL family protein N-acetyltransferase
MKDFILENDRVRLEPITQISDCEKVVNIIFNEPDLLIYSPLMIRNQGELEQYFETALAEKTAKVSFPFLIFDKTKNQYAGSTRFGNISLQNQRVEIGWTWIGKTFQGTGLNQNCKSLMLEYAFETLHCERVELKADARNLQSRKAMEKIGAKYEGCLRSHTLMSDGFRRDTVYYSILRGERLIR